MFHFFSKFSLKVFLKVFFCICVLLTKLWAVDEFTFIGNQNNSAPLDGSEILKNKYNQSVLPLQYKMVGYLESWGNIGIEEAIAQNYNILVIAFGTVNGENIGMNLNCGSTNPEGCFLPSVQWWREPPEWIENFKKSVDFAHAKGVKVLLSVGGANNTFKPGSTSVTILAQNIVNYLGRLNLDGIDFDLEYLSQTDFPLDLNNRKIYLSDLIKQIKHLNQDLIITCAPQINPVQDASGSKIQFVSTADETLYNQAIDNNLFDYIFAQAYNTPGFSVDNQCNIQWQLTNDETYPQFISKIAPCLERLLPHNAKTKIIIGEPANLSPSAGRGALEHGSYTDIANEFKKIKVLPSFGGAMTWSVNEDSKSSDNNGERTPYSFSAGLVPVLLEIK